MIFFSKNRKTAQERLNKIGKSDYYPILSKTQIHHFSNWKTYTMRKRK